MYLDAVGEARDSPRRNVHQGMWHKHVFNRDTDREIEVTFSLCVLTLFTGVHNNQDQIWLVKIEEYIGFYVDRRS